MNVSMHIPKRFIGVWEKIKQTASNAGHGIGWIVCENWLDKENEKNTNRWENNKSSEKY